MKRAASPSNAPRVLVAAVGLALGSCGDRASPRRVADTLESARMDRENGPSDPLALGRWRDPLPMGLACAAPTANGRALYRPAAPAIERLYDACRSALDGGPNLASCTELGWRLREGRGTVENAVLGAIIHARACSHGDADACAALAEAPLSGFGTVLDPKCGRDVLAYACEKESGSGCARLSELVERSDAPRFAARACELGSPAGCGRATLFVGKDDPVAATLWDRAIALATAQCDAGDAFGCVDASDARARSVPLGHAGYLRVGAASSDQPEERKELLRRACFGGVPRDCARALKWTSLDEACRTGDDVAACGALGWALYTPEEHKKFSASMRRGCEFGAEAACGFEDRKAACARGELSSCHPFRKFEQSDLSAPDDVLATACNAGSAVDCGTLAGRALDAADARAFDERACPANVSRRDYLDVDVAACKRMGDRWRDGVGVPRDGALAASFYRTACYSGSPEPLGSGCGELGQLFERGEGVPKDLDRAAWLYAEGCTSVSWENSRWCDKLHELRPQPKGSSPEKAP